MVKAWIAKINSLYFKEKYESCYQLLPEWRKEKADRLRNPKAKAQSAGVWTLWMEIRKRERLPEDAVFNLSHSGDYVMCACSDRRDVQVGCDLEMIGEMREKVARRFFCQEEYTYIIGRDSEKERQEMFYRYWVLKESFMKATRKGMGLDTRDFCIGWDEEGRPLLKKKPAEFPECYYYQEYTDRTIPAKMAVCTTDPDIEESLQVLSL